MQENSGTRQEKVQRIDVLQRLLHRERSPPDPGLDTCTGCPKGAGLVPGEVDLLRKKR